jgi:hydrophobe/amphiphile efflux-1 (HAE1) family protein
LTFTDIFIRRPVLATVVSALILIIGLQGLFSLQIREYPELSSATITVTTSYPGANADLIKSYITTPLQQAFAGTEGLDTLISSSAQNVSTITLNLLLNADAEAALTEVLTSVSQVQNQLPSGALDPVVVKKGADSTALLYVSFNSNEMSTSQINDYLTRIAQPRVQTIKGVSQAQILGGEDIAMRIWLDPDRMAARNITPSDVTAALRANNFTTAAGQVKGDFVQTSINAQTSLSSVEEFRNLTVAALDGTIVRIDDIASVELGPSSVSSSARFDGRRAVTLAIYATPTANPLTVIADVRAALPDIEAQMPGSMSLTVAYDATAFIEESINEVLKTLGEAVVIVLVVIFLFLGSLRSTLIPIVTIPLSLIGVMAMLQALGFSINLLTLLALVLAIGLVVDDAIVVVENVHRHIEEGMAPFDAAITGARDIAVPVISMTITLAAVYAPIGFVSGLTGALFKEFAFTLAGAVVVSGVVALTLSPMMCALLLRPKKAGGLTDRLDTIFDSVQNRYRLILHGTLGFRSVTVIVLVGVIGLTGMLYVISPKQLAPEEDQGVLLSQITAPSAVNLDYLEQQTERLSTIARGIDGVDHVLAINGTPNSSQGLAIMLLDPWGQRSVTQAQITAELQQKINPVTGARVFIFPLPSLPGSTGGAPVQFVITSFADYGQIVEILAEMQQRALESGLFVFVDSDLKFDTPQFEVEVDTDKANQIGLDMQDIGNALAILLGGSYTNYFSLYGRSYEVIPQVPREFRLTEDWLGRYQVRTQSGQMVPLSTVVSISRTIQPNALTTFQQLNSATLSGVPMPGRTLGEALAFLETTAQEVLPNGFSYDFNGQSRQFVNEGNTLAIAFGMALVIIYLVLAAQFESFRDPFIILIALPTSMFGALAFIYAFSLTGATSVNIYSQVGLVTLIGLISKHGILMVDFANKQQIEHGMSRREAIEEAAAVRLRPILMTTAAMVLAMIPLLIASGAGALSRLNMGLVIAAGMSIGTLFTLFVTPAVYTFIARDHNRDNASSGAGQTPQAEPN